MAAVFDRSLDDFTHGFTDDEMIAVGECDNRIGFFFDRANEIGVDNERLSIQSGDLDHADPPFSPSEDEKLLHQLIGRSDDA